MEIGHITEIPLNFTAVQFINRTSDNYQNRNFEKNNSFILFNIVLLCSQGPMNGTLAYWTNAVKLQLVARQNCWLKIKNIGLN